MNINAQSSISVHVDTNSRKQGNHFLAVYHTQRGILALLKAIFDIIFSCDSSSICVISISPSFGRSVTKEFQSQLYSFRITLQCIYAYIAMHSIQCKNNIAQNKTHRIYCIDCNTQNTIHIKQCIDYSAQKMMNKIRHISLYA